MPEGSSGGARTAVWAFVAVLAVLHYDFWFWDDRTLWFGFLPVGLGFQALISIGAAIAWLLVVRLAWPDTLEAWAEGSDDERSDGGSP